MDYETVLSERERQEAQSILTALHLLDGSLADVHRALMPIRTVAYADGYTAGKREKAND